MRPIQGTRGPADSESEYRERGVAVACFLYQYIIGGIIFAVLFVVVVIVIVQIVLRTAGS